MIADGRTAIADGDFRMREVRPDDSETLYRWRMQKDARPMFLNVDEVPFADLADVHVSRRANTELRPTEPVREDLRGS